MYKPGSFRRSATFRRIAASGIATVATLTWMPATARADLKLCNMTTSRVGIAIGYKDKKGWASEGWWNVAPSACETLLKGTLIARYYYVHAVDYDQGGIWAGKAYMCTAQKVFTIRNSMARTNKLLWSLSGDICKKRGFDRTGFFEIDTGEEKDWTVRLTESAARAAGGR